MTEIDLDEPLPPLPLMTCDHKGGSEYHCAECCPGGCEFHRHDESLTIDLNRPRSLNCFLCGDWTDYQWGVPTYNGDVVSNDFPDWLIREGGGCQGVCERCYEKHAAGKVRTFDGDYRHLDGLLIHGDGI